MKGFVEFHVACNDPDNGLFCERARGVQLDVFGELVELDADDFFDGYAFTVEESRFRLHRRWFAFTASKEWVGNWCWNVYRLERREAKRLIGMLRDSGHWRCTAGPCRWFDWFNREGRFVPAAGAAEAQGVLL